MTGFVDPHYLGGAPAQQASANPAAPLGANPGYPSAIVSMGSLYKQFTIPPPFGNAGGAVPPSLQWVIIVNCSQAALLVSAQMNLGVLAPLSQQKYVVPPSMGGVPIIVTPIIDPSLPNLDGGVGAVTKPNNGAQGNVFAVWYEHEPVGDYPSGIGDVNNGVMQPLSVTNVNTPTVGTQTIGVAVEPWMQAIAFRTLQNAGTMNGWQVFVQDAQTSHNLWVTTLWPDGQWAYFPVNSTLNGLFIVMQPLTNSVAGGSFQGFIEVNGLAGPVTDAHLGPAASAYGVAARIGLQAEVTILSGNTTTILGEPATGTMYRIRHVSVTYTAAPAAPQGIVLRGTNNAPAGVAYWRSICPTAIALAAGSGQTSFLVGGATARPDPAEGLQGVNNASQSGVFLLTYDIVPYSTVGYAGAGSG